MSFRITKIMLDGSRVEESISRDTTVTDLQKIFDKDKNIQCLSLFEGTKFQSYVQNVTRGSIIELDVITGENT